MNNADLFSIEEIKDFEIYEIIIKNNKTNEFTSILPNSGARLKEVWLNNGKKNISILSKITNLNSNERDDIFNNSKLSPFAGRIEDGEYQFNNVKYNLFVNYPEENNSCHGFIYDKEFSVIDKVINDKSAYCVLRYEYDGENKGYPFKYSIEITYELSSINGLTCTTKILNESGKTIPLSDGWHHYYNLGLKVDDLELKFDSKEIIGLNSRNIPNGDKNCYTDFKIPDKIGKRFFDSCFKINENNGKAITELISKENDIHLNIWQDTGKDKYNYLVIYTPPQRDSIAIEPMTSNVNSFNNKEGLIQLAPQEEFKASFGILLIKN